MILLRVCYSVLVMWIVNVGIILFFVDIFDGKVYFMVVNLNNKFYCLLELVIIMVLLKVMFNDECYFSYYIYLLD